MDVRNVAEGVLVSELAGDFLKEFAQIFSPDREQSQAARKIGQMAQYPGGIEICVECRFLIELLPRQPSLSFRFGVRSYRENDPVSGLNQSFEFPKPSRTTNRLGVLTRKCGSAVTKRPKVSSGADTFSLLGQSETLAGGGYFLDGLYRLLREGETGRHESDDHNCHVQRCEFTLSAKLTSHQILQSFLCPTIPWARLSPLTKLPRLLILTSRELGSTFPFLFQA